MAPRTSFKMSSSGLQTSCCLRNSVAARTHAPEQSIRVRYHRSHKSITTAVRWDFLEETDPTLASSPVRRGPNLGLRWKGRRRVAGLRSRLPQLQILGLVLTVTTVHTAGV